MTRVRRLVAGGVVFGFVGQIDLELVVDRRLPLDGPHAAEPGLIAPLGLGRIIVVGGARRVRDTGAGSGRVGIGSLLQSSGRPFYGRASSGGGRMRPLSRAPAVVRSAACCRGMYVAAPDAPRDAWAHPARQPADCWASFATSNASGRPKRFVSSTCGIGGAAGGRCLRRYPGIHLPTGRAIDDAIARQAMLETIGDLAKAGLGSFDTLKPGQLQDVFLAFISRSIEERVLADLGGRGITFPDDSGRQRSVGPPHRSLISTRWRGRSQPSCDQEDRTLQ